MWKWLLNPLIPLQLRLLGTPFMPLYFAAAYVAVVVVFRDGQLPDG